MGKSRPFEPLGLDTPVEDLLALKELVGRSWPILPRQGPWALEVGSWVGRTALALLAGGAQRVFCVDTWEGSQDDETGELARRAGKGHPIAVFCQNIGEDLFRQVFPLKGYSRVWAALWPTSRPLDLIFIDGDHSYEACRDDIQAWRQHVRPGGILAVHDYGALHTVTRAVAELMPGFRVAGRTVAWVRV